MQYDELPESADLHAALSKRHPLDWGDPIPSRADLEASYGSQATTASLRMLAKAAGREPLITSALLLSVPPGSVTHQLECRVKSPFSLARKLGNQLRATTAIVDPGDVLRFTIVAESPDDLVLIARQAVAELQGEQWKAAFARNSYVDGSRYKGLHVNFHDASGQAVELQFHSPQSIGVKTATTLLYNIERDRDRPAREREAARAECVNLSETLAMPRGLPELRSIGGVVVDERGYGLPRRVDESRGAEPLDSTHRLGIRDGPSRQRSANEGIDR
jgi:hypothetical protein